MASHTGLVPPAAPVQGDFWNGAQVCLTITGGRLGDLFGRKRMFVAGAVIFAAGSMLASLATSVPMLIIGESVIEGVGAALMLPAMASLLVASYRGRDRALALGIWGGMAAGGAAIGPVLGGFLTTHYSWRWGFRIDVFVAALLVAGSLLIRDSRDRQGKPSIDFVGIGLSSVGLLDGVFAIIEGSTYGLWTAHGGLRLLGHSASPFGLSIVPILASLSMVLLAGFFAWEQRLTARGETPLVSMKRFANSQFTAGASLTGAMSLGQVGLTFCIPVFLQDRVVARHRHHRFGADRVDRRGTVRWRQVEPCHHARLPRCGQS